ncbi:hypothetical protein LTR09_012072 [Extremus antarcticus]|uniref:ABC transporter domain-containing protein n=1 Tax=Extremus antarcticus TaxID=702011 RepID=A0AAJ0G9P2_9PEZI|nr:hypothetical protein LTR09_012072 [Extremus antarcticus]
MAEFERDIRRSGQDYDRNILQQDITMQHLEKNTLPQTDAFADQRRSNAHASDDMSTIRINNTESNAHLTEDGKEAAEEAVEAIQRNGSSPDESDEYQPINPRDRDVLIKLASRSISFHSQRRDSISLPDSDDKALERKGTVDRLELNDDILNPESPKFDLKTWIRMTLRLMDEEGIKLRNSGLVFKGIDVTGTGSALNIQDNVSGMLMAPLRLYENFNFGKKQPKQIPRNFDGLVKSGELLIVLGRPDSGCSTLLKSVTGQMHGLNLDEMSHIHFNGIPQERMMKEFKGEVIYNQEVDKHFPHLTVGETLEHAAALRVPQHRRMNVTRQQLIKHITQVTMAVYGLSHTYNTKVGNDFVRDVSGGERKRVSIAEMALAGSLLAAWDHSTRGLDSATALTFVKSLRLNADLTGSAHAVAIYQASQAIYNIFDKAVVLYEGREIFFGKADRAKAYFENMGWYCPPRQTTGNFLTSVINPTERQAAKGYEDKMPCTPEEFEKYWRNSQEHANLQREINEYEEKYPVGNRGELQAFRDYKKEQQAEHVRPKSSYVVSVPMQVKLNTKRQWQRIWNDKASAFTPIFSNIIMALIIGSVFFGTPNATAGFHSKGAVLFFAVLINALTAITEINSLYSQRPIVEKHKSYAFYHPATEALAGIVLDIPMKFLTAVAFNLVLYFMAGLRTEPAQFFIFFLTMAALTKTISQAMALAAVLVLAIVIYTGFVVPVQYMGD